MNTIGFQLVVIMAFILLSATNVLPSEATEQPFTAQKTQRLNKEDKKDIGMSQQERERVEAAADYFVKRFSETLNFGIVFAETSVPDAIQRLKLAGFFKGININQKLVEQLDDSSLKRSYFAYMSFYYLKAVYDLSIRCPKTNDSQTDSCTPLDVIKIISASRYQNLLSNEGSGEGPEVTTSKELEDYIADLNKIASLYRKHLPDKAFDSSIYKANVKRLNDYKSSPYRVECGLPEFGVDENVKVYVVEKDIFIFFFIEQNGEMKVLTLGMGN